MPNSTYFPDPKAQQADWYNNMVKEFPSVQGILGIPPADGAAWVADCRYAAFLLVALPTPVTSFSQAVTGYVNTLLTGTAHPQTVELPEIFEWPPVDIPPAVLPGVDGRRQRMVERIKASANYTPDVIGKLLRTENSATPWRPVDSVGLIRSVVQTAPGAVALAFGKQGGRIDGVNVSFTRGADAPVKVGQFTHSPALDHTALKVAGTPEERHYTVVNVVNDQEVGQPSPAVTIVVR